MSDGTIDAAKGRAEEAAGDRPATSSASASRTRCFGARGFDVPDMLAAGPRDVMVPAAGRAAAREVLLQAEIVGAEPTAVRPSPRVRAVLSPPGRMLVALQKAMPIFPPSGGV